MQIHEVKKTLRVNGFRIPVTEVKGVSSKVNLDTIAKGIANSIKKTK